MWDKAKVTERERVRVDTKARGKAKTVGQKNGGEEIAREDMREGVRGEGNIQKYNRGRQGYAKTS